MLLRMAVFHREAAAPLHSGYPEAPEQHTRGEHPAPLPGQGLGAAGENHL